MVEKIAPLGHGEINALILQALVRKLIWKNLLSVEDLRDVLFEAATRLDVDGSPQTPQAARIIVEEDLMPAFWSSDRSTSNNAPSPSQRSGSGNDR
jgi:hypothetical protein